MNSIDDIDKEVREKVKEEIEKGVEIGRYIEDYIGIRKSQRFAEELMFFDLDQLVRDLSSEFASSRAEHIMLGSLQEIKSTNPVIELIQIVYEKLTRKLRWNIVGPSFSEITRLLYPFDYDRVDIVEIPLLRSSRGYDEDSVGKLVVTRAVKTDFNRYNNPKRSDELYESISLKLNVGLRRDGTMFGPIPSCVIKAIRTGYLLEEGYVMIDTDMRFDFKGKLILRESDLSKKLPIGFDPRRNMDRELGTEYHLRIIDAIVSSRNTL